MTVVLVTGCGGYLGSVLTKMLLDRGDGVIFVDNSTYDNFNIPNDVLGIKTLKGVDAVVHLAGIVGDPACALDKRFTYRNNIEATNHIANLCANEGVKLVMASSCSVYGGSVEDKYLRETDELNPLSYYAECKVLNENYLQTLHETQGLDYTAFRMGTLFGASYRMRFDIVVNRMTADAVQFGKVTVQGGEQWRPVLHVLDAARSYMKAVDDKHVNGVINLAYDNYTLSRIGELVYCEFDNVELKEDYTYNDMRNYKVDLSKMKGLGLKPDRSVSFGVREIRRWIIGNNADPYDYRFNNAEFLKRKLTDLQQS